MGDPKGFLKTARELPRRRPVDVRLTDWREVYEPFAAERAERQAARCMDCGIPFCHHGCPLGNLIPEWNDLVYKADWAAAADRLHATNNFPEFTGRLCPAPCEAACVLGINAEPVTIKQVEVEIIDRAWADGGVVPMPPAALSGFSVAVVGSGPAGLAAAQQLTRAGHAVTVFERDDAPGGLLRYGIPEFKMEKSHLDRRLAQMSAEGTVFSMRRRRGVGGAARGLFRGGAGGRRAGRPGPAGAGPRAVRHPPGDGVPAPGEPARARVPDLGGGQARGDHRRRRHRRGLPRHGAPAGCAVGHPAGDHAEAAPGAPGEPAVADVPDDLPGRLGARGGRRARLRRLDRGVPGRPVRGGARAAADRGGHGGRALRAGARLGPGDPVRAGAAGDGLHRRRAAGAAGRPRRRVRRARERGPVRFLRDTACRACSSPGTWAAASR